jgi:hypothetical protein
MPRRKDSRTNAHGQLRHAQAVLHGHHMIRRPAHADRAGTRAPPPRNPGDACCDPPVQPDRLARLCRSGSHRHLEHRRRAGQDHRKATDDADRQPRRRSGAGCHGLLARPLAQHRQACGLRRRDPRLRAGCPVSRHPSGRLSPRSQGASRGLLVTVTRRRPVPEQPGENGRFADLGLPGRGKQRYSPARCKLPQVRQCAGTFRLCQFRLVAAAEFLKALRVVAVPLAQLR